MGLAAQLTPEPGLADQPMLSEAEEQELNQSSFSSSMLSPEERDVPGGWKNGLPASDRARETVRQFQLNAATRSKRQCVA